jgi:hypothetical protein
MPICTALSIQIKKKKNDWLLLNSLVFLQHPPTKKNVDITDKTIGASKKKVQLDR